MAHRAKSARPYLAYLLHICIWNIDELIKIEIRQ
jgi:hypothetical protein